MAEIDDILSASLKRVAQPGDATGVADAIRSRVDAGDTGTPAGSSGFLSPFRWWPWLVLLGVVLFLGGWAGAVALVPTVPVAVQSESQRPSPTITPTVVRTSTPTPTPTVSPVPSPVPAPPTAEPEAPAPPADTNPPAIQQFLSSQSTVYIANQSNTTLSAVVVDDVGVASVALSWSGAASGSAGMQLNAGTWQYVFTPPLTTTPGSTITFVAQAFDSAGNASGTASVAVQTVY